MGHAEHFSAGLVGEIDIATSAEKQREAQVKSENAKRAWSKWTKLQSNHGSASKKRRADEHVCPGLRAEQSNSEKVGDTSAFTSVITGAAADPNLLWRDLGVPGLVAAGWQRLESCTSPGSWYFAHSTTGRVMAATT